VILASVLITQRDYGLAELPETIKASIASFKSVHPDIEHVYFNGSDARKLIYDHFDNDVLAAFDKLKPYAFKCDLARLCVIYALGGIYSDVSRFFLKGWLPSRALNTTGTLDKLCVFRDFMNISPWDTSQAVFAAPAHHKALEKAINTIVYNTKINYYGTSVLSPTGPEMFGKAVALTCQPDEIVCGDSHLHIVPENGRKLHTFIFEGKVIAYKMKMPAGDQSDLGVKGGNDYLAMYYQRDIYS
jgi:mannosyltransferase OCH1-like enzyme